MERDGGLAALAAPAEAVGVLSGLAELRSRVGARVEVANGP